MVSINFQNMADQIDIQDIYALGAGLAGAIFLLLPGNVGTAYSLVGFVSGGLIGCFTVSPWLHDLHFESYIGQEKGWFDASTSGILGGVLVVTLIFAALGVLLLKSFRVLGMIFGTAAFVTKCFGKCIPTKTLQGLFTAVTTYFAYLIKDTFLGKLFVLPVTIVLSITVGTGGVVYATEHFLERHQTEGSRCLPGVWNMVTTGLTELDDCSETMKIVAVASLVVGLFIHVSYHLNKCCGKNEGKHEHDD